jgi:hypothetical protein
MAEDEALARVLDRWDAWLAEQPAALGRMLAPPAKHTQVWWAGGQIGTTLPLSLRTLYIWHNGEKKAGTIFEALLKEEMTSVRDEIGDIRFLPLTGLVRLSAERVVVEGPKEIARHRDDARSFLVPFVWIREAPYELEAEDQDDTDGSSGPADGDWVLAVDTEHEAVWLFEYADEELEGVNWRAAGVAELMDEMLERLTSGRVKVELPAPFIRETAPRDLEREARELVELLCAKELIDIPAQARGDFEARLRARLGRRPRARAVDEVVTLIEEDPAVEEVFVETDVLRVVVDEFI